jgi:hypothetical protein
MQNKIIVPGKVEKDKSNPKKHKIRADKSSESDLDIELTGEGEYDVQKISVDGLPDKMPEGGAIRWLNNFHVKKDGQYVKERFLVTIPDLGKSWLVILGSEGEPYYYGGKIKNNTFELTDGDPAVGRVP